MKHPFRDRAAPLLPVAARLVALIACCLTAAAAAPLLAQPAAGYQPGAAPFRFETTPGVLSRQVIPERSKLQLDLDPYAEGFSGSVTHQIRVTAPTAKIVLHAADLKIGKVALKDSTAAITVSSDKPSQTITLTLPAPLAAGSHELSIDFSGKLNGNGYGLYYTPYRLPDGQQKRMLATQLEAIGAREMLPCFDEPAFRPVWEVSVTASDKYDAVSNMPVTRQTTTDGKRRTEFAPTPAMSSYLLAIAVGELQKTSEQYDGIDLAIYSVAGKPQPAAYALDATKRLLAYYKAYFGTAYPLPKLDQIAVPGMRGAMENWGLITYSEDLLIVDVEHSSYLQRLYSFSTIAHEISHQWFGNLVTMAWWDGLWLNESFASWMADKATSALNPQWSLTASRAEVKERAMAIDVLANTPPIERPVARDQNSDELFDAISYEKGQSVIAMVERFAGEMPWRDGLRDYMTKHAYSNATSADLWAAIGRHTTQDVQAFATTWTRQAGFPLVSATASCRNGEQHVKLTQARFSLKSGYVPAQTWRVALLVSQPGNEQPARTVLVPAVTGTEFPAGRCGDALLVDAGGSGYYRVRYDATLQKALDGAQNQLSTADRRRLMADAWALAEAGLEAPRRAYDLIAALRADDAPELWDSAATIYRRAHTLLHDGPLLAASHAHARATLARAFATLGWEPRAGESDIVRALRADLIGALAAYGDDSVVAEARKRFDAFMADTATAGDSNVLTGVLLAVGARATPADVDRLAGLVASGKHAALEWPVLNALSATRDTAAAKAVLKLMLGEQLPRSMASRLMSQLARSGHDRLAWQFMRDNLQALYARGSVYSRRFMIGAPLRGSRDLKLAAQVHTLALAELAPDARGEVLREIAGVDRNAWAYAAIRDKFGFLAAAPTTASARPSRIRGKA